MPGPPRSDMATCLRFTATWAPAEPAISVSDVTSPASTRHTREVGATVASAMGSDYQFFTEWRVAGTIEEVKAVLLDAPSLTRWWPSVYLDVVLVTEGRADGLGTVLDLYTKGWAPY